MVDTPVGIAIETNVGQQESAVTWSAIFAGALAAAAATLIMMVIGSGFGFSVVSPWASESVGATTLALSTVIWFAVTQWAAAGFGGYLTGRLRTRWSDVGNDEVYFRDTAHGFLAWALATVVVAGVLTTAVPALVGGTVAVATNIASGAAQGASQAAVQSGPNIADPTTYYVDTLFRSGAGPATSTETAAPAPTSPAAASPTSPAPASPARTTASTDGDRRGEATRILVNGLTAAEFPEADREYLAQLVASETGLSREEAAARADEVLTEMQQAKAELQRTAEQAREAAVLLSICMAIGLLVGAFIASVAAVVGGRQRDDGWRRDVAVSRRTSVLAG